MFKIKPNFIAYDGFFTNLIELPVMSLNDGFVFNPDFHPKTLLLAELTQTTSSVGVGGVVLTVLHFPGLNKSSDG